MRAFQLQWKNGGDWKTFASGGKIGRGIQLKFEPVTARFVRLAILEAAEGPTVWEFQLFPTKP